MSMPAIFFTAEEAMAKNVRLNHSLPSEDYEELSGVDTLKMSTLWAIIDGKVWDVNMMDRFDEIFSSASEWSNRIPSELVNKIAHLSAAKREQVAGAWAATEEMSCEQSDAVDLLRAIAKIAERSVHSHREMFLFISL